MLRYRVRLSICVFLATQIAAVFYCIQKHRDEKMLNIIKVLPLCFLLAAPLNAKPKHDFYDVHLHYVHDGDTFKVSLPCDIDLFCANISVRVKGVDTPELSAKDPILRATAQKAKLFTQQFLAQGAIILKECERDKYFRIDCDVYILTPKKQLLCLADALLQNNLAVHWRRTAAGVS